MIFGRQDYNRRIVDKAGLIPEDEPVFLIRGQDPVAVKVVKYWAQVTANRNRGPSDVTQNALQQAERIVLWANKKPVDIPTPEPEEDLSYLEPFSTDGCSMFPDGKWRECCVEHDKAYWKGDPEDKEGRRKADLELMACVARKGYPFTAFVMYVGVRIGGSSWWPTSWRWGYGRK